MAMEIDVDITTRGAALPMCGLALESTTIGFLSLPFLGFLMSYLCAQIYTHSLSAFHFRPSKILDSFC